MPENTNLVPEWVDDKTINEVLFCRDFLQTHPMVSVGGAFFTKDGLRSSTITISPWRNRTIPFRMGGLLPQEKWDNTWLSKRKHKTFYLLCSFLPAGRTYPMDLITCLRMGIWSLVVG